MRNNLTIQLSRTCFERTVLEIADLLPSGIKESLDNVQILVRAWPSHEQLSTAGLDERHDLLGLYEGIPRIERGNYNLSLPDVIWLFQRPLESLCEDYWQLRAEIRMTMLHEIGHHLGWDDQQLEALAA